ncbi:nuclease-related domain-containing protein [Pyrolobus fumarii]|uniref:nuclease-related domain-containing protein n=1 Tax=Pyrolobus fumarii TaxID=54252 RepID=UPI000689BB6F|nr:nuclease-related domain-containing protein [Pyrolobus fumarii]
MQEVAASGDRLLSWERNARIDTEDIDLLIVTEKRVYVVEVKVQPKHADVGALLAKAEIVARRNPGREVIPVLTGARIGREIVQYALSKGVRVYAW